MNKIFTTAIGLFMAICSLQAQTPQSVCYQGVATDAAGVELQARTINIRTTILSDSPIGTEEWSEIHQVQTDDFGLFNLNIGQGTFVGGTAPSFSAIEWGEHAFFLKVEMDETGGIDYQLMGINQMMSVPYALYSKGANQANIAQTAAVADSAAIAQVAYSALNDEDISPFNEIQTLTFDEGTGELTLSGSNAVILSGAVNTDEQNANEVEVTNGIYNGQTVEEALENINASIVADADTDATNELQNAEGVNITTGSFNGQTVTEALESIQIGLQAGDGDSDATNEIQDATEVEIDGGIFSGQNVQQALENINFTLATDEDGDATNELQEANQVNITGGNYNGQTVEEALEDLSNAIETDADGDATNELQNAEGVNITTGSFNGQTVTEALESIQSGLEDADGDNDATNEIQIATEVEISNGTFSGQNVQQALENINFAIDADNDGDATNELQNATEIPIISGEFAGQSVENALNSLQATSIADGDTNAQNEIQTAGEVEITGGDFNGQNVEQALNQLQNQVETDNDDNPVNEIQNANQVSVTGGTYNGQTVEQVLENLNLELSTVTNQITQVINDVTTDGDGDATNELQSAGEVSVTSGTYNGQTVEQVLEGLNLELSTVTNQITQVINDVTADGDGDATNELQSAGEVNITSGTYNGQTVEQVLEGLNTELSTVITQITQVINDVTADGDGDSTNELQTAGEVNVTGGTYTGQTVESALEDVNTGITQLENDLALDNDGDSTNELQTAGEVNVTGGTYTGQTVESALEDVNTGITQLENDLALDNDGDSTNELQTAGEVNVTGGIYTGQTVESALEDVNTGITQLENDLALDNDGDSTNELQTAGEVNVTGGTYTGQTVESALEDVNTEITQLENDLALDNDGDSTNELQTAGVVDIEGGIFAGQNVEETLDTLQLRIAADNDGDDTNEIQELIYDGETLGITGGNMINLSDVPFAAPGASTSYPQGIFGDYIVVTGANYQVPTGKSFYLTGGPPTITLSVGGTPYTHPTTPSMPLLQSGQIVQNCNCLGILIDENSIVDPEIIDFQASNIYTVPVGKVFMVKSGLANDDVSYLVVNGVQIEFFRPNYLPASKVLSFPEGTTLQMPNNVSEMVLTGYLVEIE